MVISNTKTVSHRAIPGWLPARDYRAAMSPRTKAADLDAVSQYLQNQYGYDPGAYGSNHANNYQNKNIKALLRLDWNINDKHKLTLRYNQMTGTNDQGPIITSGPNPRSAANRISSESIAFENANYSLRNTVPSQQS